MSILYKGYNGITWYIRQEPTEVNGSLRTGQESVGCASHPIWTWKSQGQKIWLKSAWWSGRIHTRGKHQSIIFTKQNGLIGFNIFLGDCFKDLLLFLPLGKWTNLTNTIFFHMGISNGLKPPTVGTIFPWYSRFALLQAIRPCARLFPDSPRHELARFAVGWPKPPAVSWTWWLTFPEIFWHPKTRWLDSYPLPN